MTVRRSGAPLYVPAILLVAEVALLRVRFKTDVLSESGLGWAPLVQALRFGTPWSLCALAGVLLVGRERIARVYREEGAALARPRPIVLPACVHVAALAVFYWLSARLLDPDLLESEAAPLLPYPWLAAGACAVLSAVALSIPLGALARMLARSAGVLAAGLFLGTAAFALGSVLGEAWFLAEPLARGTLWLSDRFLGLVLDARIYEPEALVLGTEAFPVHVTKHCSGYEGMSIFLLFYLVFLALWRRRLRFPHVLLLLPLGMGLAWVLNAVRIAALVLIGTFISPDLAVDGFHVNAGWPLLCGVALGCVYVGTRVRFFSADAAEHRGEVNPTFVYLAPLILWTALGLVFGAIVPDPESLYPVRAALVLALLVWQRREHAWLRPTWTASAALYGVLAFGIWTLLLLAWPGDPSAGRVGASIPRDAAAIWWTVRAVGTCTITPILEELAFRGYLMRRLVSADFEGVDPGSVGWMPVVGSSLAFGLLHPNWIAGAGAGLAYGLAYRRRGKLFDAVVAHGMTNLFVVLASLVLRDTRLWG